MGGARVPATIASGSWPPEGLCVELKWLDPDEFAHWRLGPRVRASDQGARTRKAGNRGVYTALAEGRGRPDQRCLLVQHIVPTLDIFNQHWSIFN